MNPVLLLWLGLLLMWSIASGSAIKWLRKL
jgi:hypothetical protein